MSEPAKARRARQKKIFSGLLSEKDALASRLRKAREELKGRQQVYLEDTWKIQGLEFQLDRAEAELAKARERVGVLEGIDLKSISEILSKSEAAMNLAAAYLLDEQDNREPSCSEQTNGRRLMIAAGACLRVRLLIKENLNDHE